MPTLRALLSWLALAALTGCQSFDCSMPKIDTSGHRVFKPHDPKPPLFYPEPGPPSEFFHQAGVSVTPQRIVAPVGAEVVLKAAVCGPDGRTTQHQKVEWTIAPGSVGYIVAVGRRSTLDDLCGFFTGNGAFANKVSSNYAVNMTSSQDICLNRGTPTRDDDVPVVRGQAWITVTSPVEGQSIVTAMAPNVYGWDQRQRSAVIEWLDAHWDFPAPSINPVGARHMFVTSVVRHTNGAPLVNWRVRYEILDGPAAGFAPDGAKIVEVPTDDLGQARIEMFQVQPAEGTNHVNVQIIRPQDLSRDGTRLIVANATTAKTWGSSELFVKASGPSQASQGATLAYRFEIRNAGSHTLRQTIGTMPLPQGTSLVSTNPVATVNGTNLIWNFGDLTGGLVRTVDVVLRADRFGAVNPCLTVQTAEGKSAQDCAATTIVAPSLDVTVTADPEQAPVGSQVTFTAVVTNRGAAPANGLVIVERYDAGLRHTQLAANPIEAELKSIAPGESRKVTAAFTILAPGQQCNSVEVVSPSGLRAEGRGCVMGVQSAGLPAIPPAVPTTNGTTAKPVLTVRKVANAARRNVGDQVSFDLTISNTGTAKATNVKVVDSYDTQLEYVSASNGFSFVGRDLSWTVDELAPGAAPIRYTVNLRCTAPAANSCNRVTVTCAENVRADAEACLAIQPSPTPLSVTLDDLTDPQRVGNVTEYLLRVANAGQVADSQVQASITMPAELLPVPTGTTGPSGARIVGQIVQFDPVPQLPAGQALTYRIQARAVKAGTARVSAQIGSANMATPVTTETTTTIFGM